MRLDVRRLAPLLIACPAALAASLNDNPAAYADSLQMYLDARVQALSDPAPLSRLADDDWGSQLASRHGSNQALLDARVLFGGEESGWHMAALLRRQGLAHASADTVRLARQIDRGEAFVAGQRYALDYAVDYWQGRGLRLGRAFSGSSGADGRWSGGLVLQYYRDIAIKTEVLAGEAEVNSSQQLLFNGRRTVAGSLMKTDDPSRFNPYVAKGDPRAWGYALDLGLRWQGWQGWQFDLAGLDLLARIRGQAQPQSALDGSFLYDSDGELIGNADGSPALSGRDSRGKLTLRPEATWLAGAAWQGTRWQGGLSWQHTGALDLATARTAYRLADGPTAAWLGLAYTPRARQLEISLGNPWLAVALGSSRLNLDEARALSASLRLTVPLRPR